MEEERWLPVPSYEHVYAVSDYGRIMRTAPGKSTRVGRILRPVRMTGGYLGVYLRDSGRDRQIACHRLVAAAFIGPRPPGLDVNHIDGVKTNNHMANLEYVTRKQNIRHAFDTGLAHGTRHLGEANPAARFADRDILSIRAEFASNAHAAFGLARKYEVSYRTMWLITRGKTWQHLLPSDEA